MSNNIETRYFRNHRGYQGTSHIGLEHQRVLGIHTSKNTLGRLMTIASVNRDNGDGTCTHILCQDYNKTCAVSHVRVTEKAVRLQHESVLAKIEAILADVTAHYTSETEAGNALAD